MSILLAAYAALGGEPLISLSNETISAFGFGEQEARYTLESDGDIISFRTSVGAVDIGDWISPKEAAPGTYEVRATVVSGSLSSGTTGSWIALTSNRTWVVSGSIGGGESSCVLTVEIRKGAGSTLASATVTLQAQPFD